MRPFVRIARGELRYLVRESPRGGCKQRERRGGWNDGRTSGGRDEREEGSNANEGEGLYRYVPAAVVCNIMITLPACAWLPSSLSLALALPLVSLLRVYQAATLFQRPCCREI